MTLRINQLEIPGFKIYTLYSSACMIMYDHTTLCLSFLIYKTPVILTSKGCLQIKRHLAYKNQHRAWLTVSAQLVLAVITAIKQLH